MSVLTDTPRGLAGVVVATTGVSDVNGKEGFYHYRGVDPTAFARSGTFEDAWYLLLFGSLPDAAQRAAFAEDVRTAMVVPPVLADALSALAALGPAGSIDVLRTAVSAAGVAVGSAPWTEQDAPTTQAQLLRVAALTPVLAAALYRLARGEDPVVPSAQLGLAGNFLRMISGETPDAERVQALDTYLALAADHGFCNSTFALRVVASSGTDVGGVLASAVAALSGPLHGGAIGRVPTMLEAIGEPSRVEPWIADRLARGERLMGFGHAVYETPDPRTTVLRELARRIGGDRAALAELVEETGVRLLNAKKSDKRREANIELYAGFALEHAGVPEELFGSTFAIARMAGWTANVLEQIDDNRIFRPASLYEGPLPLRR